MTSAFRNRHLLAALHNLKPATTFLAEARQTGVLLAAALDHNHRPVTVLQADADAPDTIAQVHSAPVEPEVKMM